MPKRAVRVSPELNNRIVKAAKDGGFRTTSALMRTAIESYLKSQNEMAGIEEQNAATFDRLFKNDQRLLRSQQALFALVDALTRAFLTCVPEPAAETKAQVIVAAKERYVRLMKSAGQGLKNQTLAAMQELIEHVEE